MRFRLHQHVLIVSAEFRPEYYVGKVAIVRGFDSMNNSYLVKIKGIKPYYWYDEKDLVPIKKPGGAGWLS